MKQIKKVSQLMVHKRSVNHYLSYIYIIVWLKKAYVPSNTKISLMIKKIVFISGDNNEKLIVR